MTTIAPRLRTTTARLRIRLAKALLPGWCAIVILFLFTPIFFLIAMSFNEPDRAPISHDDIEPISAGRSRLTTAPTASVVASATPADSAPAVAAAPLRTRLTPFAAGGSMRGIDGRPA